LRDKRGAHHRQSWQRRDREGVRNASDPLFSRGRALCNSGLLHPRQKVLMPIPENKITRAELAIWLADTIISRL
jgi:hypothetical protein